MSGQNGAVERIVQTAFRSVYEKYVANDDVDRITEARRREQEIKAQKLAEYAASDSSASGDTQAAQDQTTEAIEELIAEEDCEVCQSLLAAVAEMDEPKRTKGVAEYGQFRAAVDESEEAASEAMSDSPVLKEAVQKVQGL